MNSKPYTDAYVGATAEQLNHPLVREFLAIHSMFRRELSNMLRFVDGLIAGEQSASGIESSTRIQTLAHATFRYTQLLHFHHHAESSALFPVLKGEGLDEDVIRRLEADHDEITLLVDQLDAAMRNAIEPQRVSRDLQRLAESLRTHLSYEESHVCPLLTHFSHWPMFSH